MSELKELGQHQWRGVIYCKSMGAVHPTTKWTFATRKLATNHAAKMKNDDWEIIGAWNINTGELWIKEV